MEFKRSSMRHFDSKVRCPVAYCFGQGNRQDKGQKETGHGTGKIREKEKGRRDWNWDRGCKKFEFGGRRGGSKQIERILHHEIRPPPIFDLSLLAVPWRTATRSASWKTFADVKHTFGSADQITLPNGSRVVVFNIGGGAFRLITAIHYNRGIIYIRKFLTHAQYSKEDWKNDP